MFMSGVICDICGGPTKNAGCSRISRSARVHLRTLRPCGKSNNNSNNSRRQTTSRVMGRFEVGRLGWRISPCEGIIDIVDRSTGVK
jgi:hypothetical protein